MNTTKLLVIGLLLLTGVFLMITMNQDKNIMDFQENSLLVLWTTENKELVENMLFMYSHNAKKQNWFDEITILVWGPSQKLLAADPELQKTVKVMQETGVKFIACKACADNLNVTDVLTEAGVHVFYTGQFLTDWLKSGKKMLSL